MRTKMKPGHVAVTILIISVMWISTYFGAVSATLLPPASGPPLNLFHLGPNGQQVASAIGVFSAGEEIWAQFPAGAVGPYSLLITGATGTLSSQQISSIPSSRLVPISLAPSDYPPGRLFTLSVTYMIAYSPGFVSQQTSSTAFTVTPMLAHLQLKTNSFQNDIIHAGVALQDGNNNPVTGVRLGLFLVQKNTSLMITTEKTDTQGKASYDVGKSLSGGTYTLELRVLDSNAVFASPIQLPTLTVNSVATSLRAWNSTNGQPEAVLQTSTGSPVPGRLLVLEQQLKDGNWTILASTYTDSNGAATFAQRTPPATWRVLFDGDSFYAPSASDRPSSVTVSQPSSLGSFPQSQLSTFSGNTFTNGHIVLSIGPSSSIVYDASGQSVLGHMTWEVQVKDSAGNWKPLLWDGPFTNNTVDDSLGYHRLTLQGTAGNDQVAVSMSFVARAHDALYTPLQMPVSVQALRGSSTYRMVWHLYGLAASFLQLEQRIGVQTSSVDGQFTAGSQLFHSASSENSMVALAPDGQTVLFGLNWDNALQFYKGTSLGSAATGSTADVFFGDVTLSKGQTWIIPACPCPDGGGGGGGPVGSSTNLILPTSAYATINTLLIAQVKDQFGSIISNALVNFYRDGSSIGASTTNSTGYAVLLWTPGVTGSHIINATFSGGCCWNPSFSAKSLTVNQTPTTTQLLQPQQIVYAWDLYSYYGVNGRPIVVPANILTLAATNNTSPANIIMPAYSGASSAPAHVSGYGWAGLNQTSVVTVTMNGTYTQLQNVSWTGNLYLPPCATPSSCTTTPRTGHMYLAASLSPPSTLYSSSSTSLNIPYQNLNSVNTPSIPFAIDNSQIAPCAHYTQGCSSLFTTSQGNDIIIVYTHEALDYNVPSCTFAVSDKVGLTWAQRGSTVLNDYSGGWRSQFAEFWARSVNPLSSDNITETCSSTNPSNYGYNGYQVVAISGANFNTPFDPNVSLPASMPGSGSASSVTISTANPNDMIISGVQGGSGSYVPSPGPGFTRITGTGGIATEYEIVNSPLSNFAVTFSFGTSGSWEQIADAIQPLTRISQTSTPPNHLYVGVNASYPYISVQMQNVPVALAAYVAYLAYPLQTNPTASVQCNKTSCYNVYTLPILSSIQGTDFVYACLNTSCTSVASNTQLNLLNAKGTTCLTITTDFNGVAQIPNVGGIRGCNYPYSSVATTSTQIIVSILYAIEAKSNPYPFYTNFQGFNYAIYAPQRVGSYLLNMHTYFANSPYTVLYPANSYSDVQQPYLTCCDIFLTVEKHPTMVNVGVSPGMATVIDNVNASIVLNDQAEGKGMPNASVSYSLTRTDPNPTTLTSGTITTGPKGNATLTLGKLSYGSYTLTVSWAGNSTSIASSYKANFTIWRARTIIVISPGWIHATAGTPYLFTTTLIDNATKTIIAVSGLVEQVYINGALYSNTELCATTGCSVTNYYLTNPGGNVTFPWKPNGQGQYFINATFPQQNYYPSTSFQIEASVTLRPVLLVASNSPFQPHTNDKVTWTIQAYDLLDNASIVGLSITPYINGTSYPSVTTDSTGHATFNNTFTSPGFYNVAFSSAAQTVWNSATTQNALKVFTPTTLTISGGTVYLGQQNSLSVTLKDNIGNPLGGRTVQININGASYTTVTTGTNGQASFNWQPNSLGNYTVAASYSPTAPSDAGFQPSSASVMVNVKPLTVSARSGTQSLTLNAGQGSAATSGAFSYSFQFSPTSASVTLQFNGRQSTASVNMWNEFGWICVARVFGNCVLAVPFLKIHVDMGVPNVFDLHLASFVPFGPPSGSQDVNTSPGPDVLSEEAGTFASAIIPIVGSAIIVAGGGPLDLGAVWVGGLVNALGLDVAVVAALSAFLLGTMSRDGLKSFIQGLIVPVIAGAACAFLGCQVDLPALAPPLETDIAAISAWAFYWVLGVWTPWALEGWLAAIAIGIVLSLAALIYSSL